MDKELIKEMRQAIKNDDLDLIKMLIATHEGLLNITTIFGSWLHDASTFGKYNIAKYFVECGIDVNLNGGVNDCGAITSAAFRGYLDIVELLYINGAKLDVSNSARNPLFAAIYNGHYNIVQFLVEKGIDITANYPIGQLDKVDAYEYARQYGQTEIANYLKEKLNNHV